MQKALLPFILIALIALGLILSPVMAPSPSRATTPGLPVAPECQGFYKSHGGAAFFGPPLESAIPVSGGVKQTFQNARFFCAANGQVELLPLGTILVAQDPTASTADPLFAAWVEEHGGTALFGKPLTRPQRNGALQRWEQYFENLGVALIDGTQEPVLLPYGQLVWEIEHQSNAIPQTAFPTFPPPFYTLFQQIGGQEVLGKALGPPYLNRITGNYEIVFTNGVVGLTRQSGYTQATLLPIVHDWGDRLGIQPDPLATPEPNLHFIHLEQGRGHNMPQPFFQFLEQHGGLGVLCGVPLTERRWADETQQQIVQWCSNVGLFGPTPEGGVGLLPIGEKYQKVITPEVSALPEDQNIKFTVEAPKTVRLGQGLSIHAVLTTPQGQPIANRPVILVPFGHQAPQLTTTDHKGEVWFSLRAQAIDMVGAPIYRLCLWEENAGVVACHSGSLLITR